jgi:hypothetical protein
MLLHVTWELQCAMYDKLVANTKFMELISNRLYDNVPTNQDYPYVKIGHTTCIPFNTHCKKGYELTKSFTIYTKPYGLGFYPAMVILRQMNKNLHKKKLAMDSYDMVICKLDNKMTDSIDDKRIIDVRYRILVQEK